MNEYQFWHFAYMHEGTITLCTRNKYIEMNDLEGLFVKKEAKAHFYHAV